MRILICSIAVLILNSCQVYRSHFDCEPGKGVPCTPITDIEKMIVETPDGKPDIFTGYLPSEECQTSNCIQRRVWINGKNQPCGNYVDGHYIYLDKKVMP